MAYRNGDRSRQTLLPPSVEDYVGSDAPVRAYDATVEAMGLAAMGFVLDQSKAGNSQCDPQAMLKLLVYGYSYGIRSSRKLEREWHNKSPKRLSCTARSRIEDELRHSLARATSEKDRLWSAPT